MYIYAVKINVVAEIVNAVIQVYLLNKLHSQSHIAIDRENWKLF